MKKILSALIAATMLGALLTAPVSAEETTYKMGDVNMDGYIGADDAQLVLLDFLEYYVTENFDRRTLTEEQIRLGDIVSDSLSRVSKFTGEEIETPLTSSDAQYIQFYYLESLTDPQLQETTDIIIWLKQRGFIA